MAQTNLSFPGLIQYNGANHPRSLAMGEQLASILLECNVDPATAAGTVAAGWTPDTLAIFASSPNDLESHLEEIATGVTSTFQQKLA